MRSSSRRTPARTSPVRSHTAPARTAAVALAAAAALTLTAGADAASAKGFDLTTGTSATPGRAHGYGSVTFPNARTVKMRGKINDQCPKDGFGAYVEFRVNFAGGGYGTKTYADTRSCSAAAKAIGFTQTFPKKVVSVGVTVIELDQLGGGKVRAGDAAQKLIRR